MHRSQGLIVAASMLALVLVFMLMPAQSANAFSTSFNFDGYGFGTPAESVSLPGFSLGSPASPNSWSVQSSAGYASLSGNVLRQMNCNAPLVIRLDAYQKEMSLRFALTNGAQRLRIEGFAGSPNQGSAIFHQSYYGSPNGLGEGILEGSLNEDVQGMNYLVIDAPDGCATLDDLRFEDGNGVIVMGDINVSRIPRLPIPEPLPLPIEPIIIRGN